MLEKYNESKISENEEAKMQLERYALAYRNTELSGLVPQISVVLGDCTILRRYLRYLEVLEIQKQPVITA